MWRKDGQSPGEEKDVGWREQRQLRDKETIVHDYEMIMGASLDCRTLWWTADHPFEEHLVEEASTEQGIDQWRLWVWSFPIKKWWSSHKFKQVHLTHIPGETDLLWQLLNHM